jgi:hypothetical protein
MVGKLESILRKQLGSSGLDYRKFQIGGYDRGTYGAYCGHCVYAKLLSTDCR